MNRYAGLIISTPPPKEATTSQSWLKCGAFPLRVEPCWLDVVVGVQDNCGRIPHRLSACDHGGCSLAMAINTNLMEKARQPKQICHESGTGFHVSQIKTVPRDRRDTNQGSEVCDNLGCSSYDHVAQS
jgi:hypothetical protein